MRKLMLGCALASLVALSLAAASNGGDSTNPAAATDIHPGLAALYPGDVGLDGDSSVVFSEDFEGGDIATIIRHWTTSNNKDKSVLSLSGENAPGSPGRHSLLVTATKGHDEGGDLWKLLDKGYDRLYARFYVRFAPDAPYVHHFVHLGGKTSGLPYPEGGAGQSPTGSDRFSTSIDLNRSNANPPGAWNFYSYWFEMHSWQTEDGKPDGRPNPYYGNLFGPPSEKPAQAKRGVWQCVEMMIKLNTPPDGHDGEEAFWIDGKLVDRWATGTHEGRWVRDYFRQYGTDAYKGGATANSVPLPFEGFRWRKSEDLKINWFWLEYYLAHIFENNVKPQDPGIPYNSNVGKVEFDNVVLATRYIGPIALRTGTGR